MREYVTRLDEGAKVIIEGSIDGKPVKLSAVMGRPQVVAVYEESPVIDIGYNYHVSSWDTLDHLELHWQAATPGEPLMRMELNNEQD